jgi:hypothetical protein
MSNPFRYFNSSPEVIRRVVMMDVRYPLSLHNVEDLLAERGIDISMRPCGSGGTGLASDRDLVGMENGRVVARQANDALAAMFESVRADIVVEYFGKEHNASVFCRGQRAG